MSEQIEWAKALLASMEPDPLAEHHVEELERALGLRCVITGCDNPHRSSGYCDTHYRKHVRLFNNHARRINDGTT